jgi:hypothetical protein
MPKKKLSRPEIIQALKDAVEDVRLNGRQGRTVPEIARQYGLKETGLRVKLSKEGLTAESIPERFKGMDDLGNTGEDGGSFDSNSDGSPNSLTNKGVSELSIESVGNRGDEGVTTAPMPGAHSSGGFHAESAYIGPERSSPNSSISEADSAILAVKTEVVREYRRLLREARRQVEIKSVRDYKAVADHLLELLGDTKGTGKAAPLIQVTILGDSGNREPRMVRAINDSANDSGAIEAESVTL